MPRIARNSRRSRTSCSVIALATALVLGPSPAAAQSLLGTGTFITNTGGSANIATGAGTTTVTLNGGQTIINWIPTDNASGTGTNINFQNAGTTALFTASSDFAVLNRVLPTDISRAIIMNGTVNSRVGAAQRGSVYFYSPSGFIFGGTSVFNVGSLVVTTSDLVLSGNNFINGPDNTVVFGQALNPNAAISSGGTISANSAPLGVLPPGTSYVAMVAPRVVHNGTITVNGSAALVAAEAATINFSPDGLFDIQVTVGTDDDDGIRVNGDIGGPSPASGTDRQGVYLVAVPKNDALTMVIGNGSDLGFTLAGSAAIDDAGVVVLSAGHDITDGAIGAKSAAPGTGAANFWFTGAHATNNLFGEATGTADLYSIGGQPTTIFNNDVTVHAGTSVRLGSSGIGNTLTVGGDVSLSSDRTGGTGQSATAGEASIYAWNGGAVSITGSTTLSADGTGGDASSGTAGNGTGGYVSVSANDGSTLTMSNLSTSAIGTGGNGLVAGVNAGNGTGGNVQLYARDTGAIVMNTPLVLDARGYGGNASGAGLAGNGAGGVAQVDILNNASLTINGDLTLLADGTGGSGEGLGGSGNGGIANIGSDLGPGGGSTMTVNGNTSVIADGYGGGAFGTNGIGGDATGGDSFVGASANTFLFNGNLTISASANGGNVEDGTGGGAEGGVAALDSAGANIHVINAATVMADATGGAGESGGDATGGYSRIESNNIQIDGSAFVSANGSGGFGFNGDGGDGSGGLAGVGAFAGTLHFGSSVFVNADGNGGGAQNGGSASGDGTGGAVHIEANANGVLDIDGSLYASADGFGGDIFGFGVNGGSGTGGGAYLQAFGANATVTLGSSVDITANGRAGSVCIECNGGGIGGDGVGGDVTVQAFGAATASMSIAGNVFAAADGEGGDGVTGAAGDGTGGSVYLGANDGADLMLNSGLFASAEGDGGYSYGPGDGGQGTGGTVSLNATSGGSLSIDFGGYLDADGYGGSAGISASGNGGDGFGGIAGVYANGGSIDIGSTIFASGGGEGGFSDNATGGDGLGKTAEIVALNGGSATIGGSVILDVTGTGGNGYVGGNGVGGGTAFELGGGVDGAHIFAKNGSITVIGLATLDASGFGGEGGLGVNGSLGGTGGAGGDGSGGWATVFATNDDLGGSQIAVDDIFISADGSGGNGGLGGSGNQGGNGGAGGDGTGGLVSVTAAAGNGMVTANDVFASAIATGGAGGDGGNGDGAAGGNGADGGNAEGGGATVGTQSGAHVAIASNLGVATFNSVSLDTSATGGNGGNGNFGGTSGNGGDGGDAIGGAATLLVRGSTVNVETATLAANATGGAAGFGYVPEVGTPGTTGIGGDATVGGDGGIAVIATGRFLIPAQRGTLNAGSISGTAIASSGIGIPDGDSTSLGGSEVTFLNADGSIGSLDFQIGFGGQNTSASGTDSISVINGAVGVVGEFSFTTPSDLSFYIDNGSLTADTLSLTAGNFVTDPAQALPPVNRGTAFANNLSVTSGGDFIADANFNVVNGIDITVPGSIRFGDATTISFVDLDAQGGSIDLDDITADGDVNLDANGSISLDTVQAGFFRGDAGGTFTSNNITSDSDIRIGAGGDVTLGDLSAGLPAGESSKAIRIDTDGSVLVGDMVALGGIDVTAQGSVTGENVTTGDVLITEADGAISYGNISAGLVDPQPATEPVSVALDSATSINVGNIDAAGMIGLITSGTLIAGDVTTGTDILALVHGNMTIGDIDADGRVLLADSSMFTNAGGTIGDAGDDDINPEDIFAATQVRTGGSITVGAVLAGSFTAAAGTSLTAGLIDTDSEIALGANGAITTGDLFAGDFVLANGGSITTGDIDASSVEMASTGGNITSGDIAAFGDVELDAFGDILTGDIVAGSIDLFAGDDITTGDLTTQQLVLLGQEGGTPTFLFPGASITLEAGDDIATGNIDSIDGVYANAGGDIATGWIEANDFVELFAVDDISTGYIDAGQYILVDSGGDQSLGNLAAGWDIELVAGGNLAFGDADAGTEFDFEAGGNVGGGDIVAGIEIGGEGAGGTVTLGDLTAGFGEGISEDTFSIGFTAGGSITVGDLNGAQRVGFGTLGNLTTGDIQAGWDFLALASGNIVTGSITTGEGDRVYMAHSSMCVTGGGCGDAETDFDPEIVFALDPVPTGGSITINGPVSTGIFDVAAGTGLTTQAITADDIHARAGGTATLNGVWDSSGQVTLSSNDIDITTTGGIDAEGFLTLNSTNATQMLIGDGLTGTGYALSNAEFGRISGYEVEILGRGDASAAIDMLIGDLNVTGPQAGSNVEGSDLIFATYDFDSEAPVASGVIRVVGDVNATGFGIEADQSVNFVTSRFELDAATGSVSIFSSGTTLGGELGIYADRIHVAEGSILNQLATNPTYTGYQEDLDEAATVQRPEGVLRADTLWIESDNLQDILIQNTGTFETRAGFLVREAFVNDDEEVAGPPGSINMVVNGQVVTEGGTLTGIEARDALITEETDITPFTSNSTINGCPLTGACIIRQPEPPPTANVVDNQIDLITGNPFGDSEFDDNQEGDEGGNNPISPPQPLFDTRPLIPSSDVNDPVSGTGNPALVGGECDDDDEETNQCATKKEDEQ